jgi:uncharacterized membrane protein YqjE
VGELADAAIGLRRAGADVLATLVEGAGTRLQLAAAEIDEAQHRLAGLVANAVLALLLIDIGALLAAGWLVWWTAPENRLATLGALALGFVAAALLALLALRRRLQTQPALLQFTLAELRRDALALRSRPAP